MGNGQTHNIFGNTSLRKIIFQSYSAPLFTILVFLIILLLKKMYKHGEKAAEISQNKKLSCRNIISISE